MKKSTDGLFQHPDKIRVEKRIAVLGGSVVVGPGLSPVWNFSNRLQEGLRGRGWNARVVNLGRIGYGSRQLRVMLQEALAKLDLDVVVIFLGNNEYLEANARLAVGELLVGKRRRALEIMKKSAALRFLAKVAGRFHRVAKDREFSSDRPLPTGVKEGIHADLRDNLKAMIRACAEAKVRPLLVVVPVNLRYTPTRRQIALLDPYPEEHRVALDRFRLARLLGRGEEALAALDRIPKENGARGEGLKALRAQLAADEESAKNFWQSTHARLSARIPTQLSHSEALVFAQACAVLGRNGDFSRVRESFFRYCDETSSYCRYYKARFGEILGRPQDAARDYEAARDLDFRRIRADSAIHRIVRETASETGVELFDAASLLSRLGEGSVPGDGGVRGDGGVPGVPGYDLFFDYCHLNLFGHLAMGHALAAFLMDEPVDAAALAGEIKRLKRALTERGSDGRSLAAWMGYDDQAEKMVSEDPPGPTAPLDEGPIQNARKKIWRGLALTFRYAGNNPEELARIMRMIPETKGLKGLRDEIFCLLEGTKCDGPGFLSPDPSDP